LGIWGRYGIKKFDPDDRASAVDFAELLEIHGYQKNLDKGKWA
jgi:hypothetical protein